MGAADGEEVAWEGELGAEGDEGGAAGDDGAASDGVYLNPSNQRTFGLVPLMLVTTRVWSPAESVPEEKNVVPAVKYPGGMTGTWYVATT